MRQFLELERDLLNSLRRGYLFGCFDDPLDRYGRRIVRVIQQRLSTLTQSTPNSGVNQIAGERGRQITCEGWTPAHDDAHKRGELVSAAACYLAHGSAFDGIHPDWPWEESWWKPSDIPIRNLVKAGALIAAEIDRLQRAQSTLADPPCSNGHTYTNQFGDDWTPERGTLCDCGKKQWT